MVESLDRDYFPRTKLLLLGGGPKPQQALNEFFRFARRNDGSEQVMVITWASEEPAETARVFLEESAAVGASNLKTMFESNLPNTDLEVDEFRVRLSHATAVFFSGGDQRRIMTVLNQWPSIAHGMRALLNQWPSIAHGMRALYHSGVVFGGTSAGTAIMTPVRKEV